MIDLLDIRCVRLGIAALSVGDRQPSAIGGSLATGLLRVILDKAKEGLAPPASAAV